MGLDPQSTASNVRRETVKQPIVKGLHRRPRQRDWRTCEPVGIGAFRRLIENLHEPILVGRRQMLLQHEGHSHSLGGGIQDELSGVENGYWSRLKITQTRGLAPCVE